SSYVDWLQTRVSRLQADHVAGLLVEALQGGFGAFHERNDNVSIFHLSGSLYQHQIAAADMIFDHRIAAHLECEDVRIVQETAELHGFTLLDGFHGRSRRDTAEQRDF